MSDSEDHHFESKADAGASKTYPMQAGAIRKGGFLVIKNRPCKVRILLDPGWMVLCVIAIPMLLLWPPYYDGILMLLSPDAAISI